MAGLKAGVAAEPTPHLPYAGLELRLVAFILDVVVLISFLMLLVAVGGLQTLFRSDFGDVDPPESAFYVWGGFILAFIPFGILYYILLLAWKGQTIGKMAVHIRVVRRDGGSLSLGQAFVRWLGYLASALPLGMGFLMALVDGERRALHDLLAGTVVVEVP